MSRRNRVFRRPGQACWYVRVGCRGRDVWRSTRETDKARAIEVAARIRQSIRGERTREEMLTDLAEQIRALPEADAVKAREAVVQTILGTAERKVALVATFDRWLSSPIRAGHDSPTPGTLANYRAIWERFCGWIEAHRPSVKHLHEVTSDLARIYLADLLRANVTAGTYTKHVRFLRSVWSALSEEAGVTIDPWARFPKRSGRPQSRRELTEEEIQRLFQQARGDMRYWIALGLYTGLRLGDVIHIRRRNLVGNWIVVTPRKTERSGRKVRVPLHPVLRRLLGELRRGEPDDYLFPAAVEIYAKNRAAIAKQVGTFFESCGIRTRESMPGRRRAVSRVGFHSLRHSFVSLCAAGNVPRFVVQDLVGHGSPAMTEHYEHVPEELKVDALRQLPEHVFTPKGGDKGERPAKSRRTRAAGEQEREKE